MKTATKIFIIEEHHEAYFIWKYAAARGFINPAGHTLVHIDEHSDMGTPFLNMPPPLLNNELDKTLDFVYKELGIATFIVPAIYEGMLDSVYWIKQRHQKTNKKSYKMYVRSQNNAGTLLATGRAAQLEQFDDESKSKSRSSKYYRFYKQHIDELGTQGPVLLDIDLDYFSCIQNPLKNELQIEITQEEFEKFNQTPYHRIRFYDFGRVDAYQDGDRFFYSFNRIADPRESPLKVKSEIIMQRIEYAISYLQAKVPYPLLITICRSRLSGYTPSDQWEFIEQQLLKSLNNIYTVESCTHIDQVFRSIASS